MSTASWRLLVHDRVGAAEGLAVDDALLGAGPRDGSDWAGTLRLYTYQDFCALVGRYQHLDAELDLAACHRRGVQVNRRPSGGGAIVMGQGQLGLALVTTAPSGGVAQTRPRELLGRYAEGIVLGLRDLGIDARFHGKNDLEVNGRKIAGLGLSIDPSGALLFHASILADLDLGAMVELLRIPAAKLGDKAVAAIAERLTTVTRERHEPWDGAALRPVIAAGIARALDIELVAGELDEEERRRTEELLAARYRNPVWLHLRAPQPDETGVGVCKTPGGLLRVYVARQGPTIKSVLFTGDFTTLAPALVRLESALRWQRLDAAALLPLVTDAWDPALAAEVSPDVLVNTILEAGQQALLEPASPSTNPSPSPALDPHGAAGQTGGVQTSSMPQSASAPERESA